MSKEDIEKYFQMFRATLFGDQESVPAEEGEEDYEEWFSKNLFGDDGEKELRRKWMASKSAGDRKELAVEGWRVMFGPTEPTVKVLGQGWMGSLHGCPTLGSEDG